MDACLGTGEGGAFGFLDVPQFDTQVQVSIIEVYSVKYIESHAHYIYCNLTTLCNSNHFCLRRFSSFRGQTVAIMLEVFPIVSLIHKVWFK